MVGSDNDIRTVEDRNRVDRPGLVDVVKLDDVWQILDDLSASSCTCPFPDEEGYVRAWCPVHDPDGTHHAQASGVDLIAAERERQKAVEDWTPEHDDEHTSGELAAAGAAYAYPTDLRSRDGRAVTKRVLWPWRDGWRDHVPDERVRELAKAGALIAAEIDRLLRSGVGDDA